MSALLDCYRRQATLLGRPWKPWLDELSQRELVAVAGGFAGLEANPTIVNSATVTGGATELTMIPTALMPIGANPQCPKLYRLWASGTSTTAATPGTYTLAVRIGPSPTNASPLFGAVSSAFTPVASATAAQWQLNGWVLIRTGGTASVAVCSFEWGQSGTIGGGGPTLVTSNGIIGGISATFDSTSATNLWIGVTHATSTTNTWVPQSVAWGSWN